MAAAIREWAGRKRKAFSPADICAGIGVAPGPERDRVRHAITDFLARGEMDRAGNGLYRYAHAWSRGNRPSPIQARLVKAVYVSGPAFTTADIMRWAEAPDRNYVQKLLRRLCRSGHVAVAGVHRVPQGRENVYRVTDRVRFRKDLM